MKKSLAVIYIVIMTSLVVISVIVIALNRPYTIASDYSTIKLVQQSKQQHTVYIGGAVINEGYYVCTEGDTYYDLLSRAGLLSCSYCHASYYDQYDFSSTTLIIDYMINGELYYSINANGIFFDDFASQYGITSDQIEQCKTSGAFTSKTQLRQLFGTLYEQVHYMIYVGES
ncbi:MAG: hypothetical protein PHW00_04550 [Clostridia bacterium]|nr:hypothetical protein [Clostridia bacterium]